MDSAAGALRRLRDRGQQRVAAPLHAVGAELDVEQRAGRGRRDLVHQRDEVFRRQRCAHDAFDRLACIGRQRRQNRLGRAVDQRIAVAHGHGKADAHADIARGTRERRGFARKIGQALWAREMHHDHANAAQRGTRERDDAGEIRIDGRNQRLILQPGFERLAAGAERTRADWPAVIVGIDQSRQSEQRLGIRGGDFRDPVHPIILDLNLTASSDRPVGRFDQVGAIDCPHDGSDCRGTLA